MGDVGRLAVLVEVLGTHALARAFVVHLVVGTLLVGWAAARAGIVVEVLVWVGTLRVLVVVWTLTLTCPLVVVLAVGALFPFWTLALARVVVEGLAVWAAFRHIGASPLAGVLVVVLGWGVVDI